MKSTFGTFDDSYQVMAITENSDATWTVRLQNLTSGIYLPDVTCEKQPELFVGAKVLVTPKLTPISG